MYVILFSKYFINHRKLNTAEENNVLLPTFLLSTGNGHCFHCFRDIHRRNWLHFTHKKKFKKDIIVPQLLGGRFCNDCNNKSNNYT